MSLEEDCSTLFRSLKSIQCDQKKFKGYSDELLKMLLMEVGKNDNDKKELNINKQESDFSMHKLTHGLSRNDEENVGVLKYNCFGDCDMDASKSKIIHDMSINKSFQSHPQDSIASKKFPYLKKGQGMLRFNYKICKGFKKKSDDRNSKSSNEIKKLVSSVSPNEFQNKRYNTFEKLEKLAESESFCSTSSKVLGLLQGSISYASPISSKVLSNNSPIKNRESITVRESSESYECHMSPVRKLFSDKQTSSFLYNNAVQTCGDKEIQTWKQIVNNSNNVDSSSLFSSSQRFISGILKKSNIKNSNSKIPTPLSTKVKFLEQEVKVLEYENLTSSDDTDLLNLSDIENLALANFSQNLNEKELLTNYFTDKESYFPSIERVEKSQSISENSLKPKTLLGKNKCVVNDIDKNSTQENFAEVKNLGEKSCKMLLLAKIYELNKEISIYKTKNKCLQESKKVEDKPMHEKLKNSFPSENCAIVKSKFKNTHHSVHKKAFSPEDSLQVQKVTKELRNLKSDYNLLMKEDQKLRMNKPDVKKVNERKTNIKRANKCKPIIKKGNEYKNDVKNAYGNFVNAPGHSSCQSQNINKKHILFSNLTSPVSTSEKAQTVSVSKNSSFCTTTTTSHHKNLVSPEIKKEISSNDFSVLEENTRSPLNSSASSLKLYYSSHEKCQGTNTCDALEDSMAEKDVKMYSLVKVTNESSNNIHCSEMITESFKIPLLKVKTSKNGKMKPKSSEKVSVPKRERSFSDSIEINDKIKSGLPKIGGVEYNTLTYPNGDKEINYPNKNVYHYAINNSTRTVYINEGREEVKYANGQKEIYYADGSYEVSFPDFSSKIVDANGTEIYLYQNGTKIQINKDKTKIIHFPNGQKEIHKSDSTWRIYPDGTTKILYEDGREETRYASGKIRFKKSE